MRFSLCQVYLAPCTAQRTREVGRVLDRFLSRVQRNREEHDVRSKRCVVYTAEANVSRAKSGNNTFVLVFPLSLWPYERTNLFK